MLARGEALVTAGLSFLALDAHLASVEAQLDGVPFPSGGQEETIGPHELVVTASDKSGYKETVRMRFEVVPPLPEFRHALCATTEAALRLYAPEADVTLSNNSRLHGAVVGRDVLVENRNEIMLTPGPQAVPAPLACE